MKLKHTLRNECRNKPLKEPKQLSKQAAFTIKLETDHEDTKINKSDIPTSIPANFNHTLRL